MICGMEGSGRAVRAGQRRQSILEAARTLFIEHGFHQTGMAQIAERSGVKVGQIYRDFANKEQIVTAICEADLAASMVEETLATALRNEDRPALREWMHRFCTMEQPVEQSRLMAEIIAEASRNEHLAASLREIEERVGESMTAALNILVPEDRRHKRHEEIQNIIMAMHVGIMMRMAINPTMPTEELFQHVTDLLDEALGEHPIPAHADNIA